MAARSPPRSNRTASAAEISCRNPRRDHDGHPRPEILGLAPLNRLRSPAPPPIHAAATPNPSAAALPRAEHPPPVSNSAEAIPRCRSSPGRPDCRDSLAGTPRVDLWSPGTGDAPRQPLRRASSVRLRQTSPPADLPCSNFPFKPAVRTCTSPRFFWR